jgi:hypothetical protein
LVAVKTDLSLRFISSQEGMLYVFGTGLGGTYLVLRRFNGAIYGIMPVCPRVSSFL